MSTVTAAPSLRVQRWTLVSGAFTSSGVALIAALAFVPVVMSENAMQKLTSLYVLVILAVMWNALAGFGGLVSIGQQGPSERCTSPNEPFRPTMMVGPDVRASE